MQVIGDETSRRAGDNVSFILFHRNLPPSFLCRVKDGTRVRKNTEEGDDDKGIHLSLLQTNPFSLCMEDGLV